jgi:acetylornithine deacetylase/succinyl-diaminopimelate desuccinylase-like protein
MLVAAARMSEEPPERGRLSLLLTADEEDGAYYGAQLVAASTDLDVDGIVIGEPGGIEEDFDRLHLVSRGIARLRLVARARQGHSSLSGVAGTRNAGVDAARLVVAVDRDVTVHVPDDPDDLAGWEPTVNTGMLFEGGVGFGVLPGRIAVDTEVRLLPGITRDQVMDAFQSVLAKSVAETGAELSVEFDAEPNDWLPAAQVSLDSPLAQAAQRACEQVFGRSLTPSVFPGTTDATWFDHLRGIPTLPALGPGLLSRAHGADEWVSVAAVRQAVDLYVAICRDFCSASSASSALSASAEQP